jgi:hypothetical protein
MQQQHALESQQQHEQLQQLQQQQQQCRSSPNRASKTLLLGTLLASFETLDLEQKNLQRILDSMGLDDMGGDLDFEGIGNEMDAGTHKEMTTCVQHTLPAGVSAMPVPLSTPYPTPISRTDNTPLGGDIDSRSAASSAVHRFFHDIFIAKHQSQFDSTGFKQDVQQFFTAHTRSALVKKQLAEGDLLKLQQIIEEFSGVVEKYLPSTVTDDICDLGTPTTNAVLCPPKEKPKQQTPLHMSFTDQAGMKAEKSMAPLSGGSEGMEQDSDIFFDAETGWSEKEAEDQKLKSRNLFAFLVEVVVNGM